MCYTVTKQTCSLKQLETEHMKTYSWHLNILASLNRPCVARAALQTPFWLSNSWVILSIRIFRTLSIPNHKNYGAEILWECSPPTRCPMSCVTCHMSGVRCQVSGVRCQVSQHMYIYFFFDKVVELIGFGSVINGA